jgi:chemotaxis protein histidine kinase CheA
LRLQQEAQAAADEAERQRLEAEAAAVQAAAVAAELEAAKKTAIEELGEDQYVMKFESIHCCYAAKINAVQNVAEILDVKNKILNDAQKLEDAEIAMREAEKTAEELRQKATEAEAARIKAIQENASEAAQKAATEAARVAKEQALQAEKMKRDAEAQAKKDAEKMISQTVRFKDGNTRATTSTSKTYVDKSGASIEKKCISISDLHSANKWVDHLFNTLGQTKCANTDQVNSARSAAKLDFISGSIARSNQQYDESNQHYIKGIDTAKPYLDKAFSGQGINGSNNNNAQGSTQSMSNNLYQTQSGITNNIRSPNNPVWQDQRQASQFGGSVLPNGFVVQKGNGECPNGCKFPQYDNKSCEDVIYNGKQYRKCPWVKDGLNGNDCMKCGAILMPKNHHGYARTAPGLFNNVSMEMASKSTQQNSDYYNIGKQFMNQLSKIKNFNLPKTISANEFMSIGKLVHKYQTEKTQQTERILTDFISGILATTSISNQNKIQQNVNIPTNISREGGVFHMDVNKLTGKGANAYIDAEKELATNNRLGGSSSLYEKQINDQTRKNNGIPRDPRKRPSPYNSIWNVFNY